MGRLFGRELDPGVLVRSATQRDGVFLLVGFVGSALAAWGTYLPVAFPPENRSGFWLVVGWLLLSVAWTTTRHPMAFRLWVLPLLFSGRPLLWTGADQWLWASSFSPAPPWLTSFLGGRLLFLAAGLAIERLVTARRANLVLASPLVLIGGWVFGMLELIALALALVALRGSQPVGRSALIGVAAWFTPAALWAWPKKRLSASSIAILIALAATPLWWKAGHPLWVPSWPSLASWLNQAQYELLRGLRWPAPDRPVIAVVVLGAAVVTAAIIWWRHRESSDTIIGWCALVLAAGWPGNQMGLLAFGLGWLDYRELQPEVVRLLMALSMAAPFDAICVTLGFSQGQATFFSVAVLALAAVAMRLARPASITGVYQ